jgi:hypothetical protein
MLPPPPSHFLLPRSPRALPSGRVEDLIAKLGLSKVANSQIGFMSDQSGRR